MPDDDLDIADALEAAADYLQTFGWTQNTYGCDGEPRCAQGAVYSVTDDCPGNMAEPLRYLSKYLEDVPEAMFCRFYSYVDKLWHVSVGKWNDRVCKSADQVIDTLREAAAEWRTANHEIA